MLYFCLCQFIYLSVRLQVQDVSVDRPAWGNKTSFFKLNKPNQQTVTNHQSQPRPEYINTAARQPVRIPKSSYTNVFFMPLGDSYRHKGYPLVTVWVAPGFWCCIKSEEVHACISVYSNEWAGVQIQIKAARPITTSETNAGNIVPRWFSCRAWHLAPQASCSASTLDDLQTFQLDR